MAHILVQTNVTAVLGPGVATFPLTFNPRTMVSRFVVLFYLIFLENKKKCTWANNSEQLVLHWGANSFSWTYYHLQIFWKLFLSALKAANEAVHVAFSAKKCLDPIALMHFHFLISLFPIGLIFVALIGEETNKEINMHEWESVHEFSKYRVQIKLLNQWVARESVMRICTATSKEILDC